MKKIIIMIIAAFTGLSLISCNQGDAGSVLKCPETQQEWDALLPEYEEVFSGAEITYALEDIDYILYAQGAGFSQFEDYCELLSQKYPETVSSQVENENIFAQKVLRGRKDKKGAFFEVTVDYEPSSEKDTALVTVQVFYNNW